MTLPGLPCNSSVKVEGRAVKTRPVLTITQCRILQTLTLLLQGRAGGAVQRQLQDLLKDNHILKRAVAIQNNRIQEATAKEAQLQQLRQLVSQYEQKIHSLELSNYSLAMHLRQATSTISGSQRSPDVF